MSAKRTLVIAALCAVLLMLAACGGTGSTSTGNTPSGPTSSANLTITDNPPAGVAVLSFEVTLNSVTLQPGDVSLLSKPERVELTKLQAHTAFLDSKQVPAGTYTGMTVTFSNPELSITNNTGAAIGNCAVGATCEIKPALGQGQFSYTSTPFPITVGTDNPFGLLVDFDLNSSIQNDLSIVPVLKIAHVIGQPGKGPEQDIDDIAGKVTAKDTTANTITLQTGGTDGKQYTVTVDANTVYKDFDEAGMQNAFASVAVGQFLKADLKLQAGGVLLAKVIELGGTEHEQELLEGMIVSIDSPTQFKMVVHEESPDVLSVDTGSIVTITINPGIKPFTKDDLHVVIPQGVQFLTSADMMVGQRVLVIPATPVTGTPPATTTDAIRLLGSSITARVAAINGANITVDNLPAIFTSANPSVTSMIVSTSDLTAFENVSGVAGLNVGDQISFDGLLFQGNPPVVAARKVRKR